MFLDLDDELEVLVVKTNDVTADPEQLLRSILELALEGSAAILSR